jgi:GcpE protein
MTSDTIRISLSADPVEEVKAGFEILKSLNLRRRGVTVISCPSCARQQFEVSKTVERLEERLAHITTPMTGAARHPISATVQDTTAAGSPFELSGPGPKTKPETAIKSTPSEASTIAARISRASI